jgi:hypothetical protein
MIANWLQGGQLVLAVITLIYLVRYVRYTKKIADHTVIQAEATFKPAIIAVQHGIVTTPPQLKNIGKGPALDIQWTLTGTGTTQKGETLSYLEAGETSGSLPVTLPKFEYAAVMSNTNKVSIECSYKSISGRKYTSINDYNFDTGRFSTRFRESD